jgi:hypothetical protein
MPFSETTHGERVVTTSAQWDHIYEKWIKRAIASYKRQRLRAERSAAIPGNFIRGIVSDLAESLLVIADVTGSKPNVFYELGIRHALRTGTVIITQDLSSFPSDLKGYYAFEYSYSDKAHEYEVRYSQFEKELHEKIDAFLDGRVASDSPVSDFLGFRKESWDRQLDSEKARLKRLVEECKQSMAENFHVCQFLVNVLTKRKPSPIRKWPIIDVGPMDALYNALLSTTLELIGAKPLDALRKVVSFQRKALLLAKHHFDRFFIFPDQDNATTLLSMMTVFMKQKSHFERNWKAIEKGVDAIKANLVLTEKGKKRVLG